MVDNRKSFVFLCSWAEAMADLEPIDRCAAYDAIIAYVESGILPEGLTGSVKIAFKFMQRDVDRAKEQYENKCKKNRESARKRWDKADSENANEEEKEEEKEGMQTDADAEKEMPNMQTDADGCERMQTDANGENDMPYIDNDNDNDFKEKLPKGSKKKNAQRFSAPSVTDVIEFAESKGYELDAEAFVDYYTSVGWKVGRNPMRDWRAAVGTWCRREKSEQQPAITPRTVPKTDKQQTPPDDSAYAWKGGF